MNSKDVDNEPKRKKQGTIEADDEPWDQRSGGLALAVTTNESNSRVNRVLRMVNDDDSLEDGDLPSLASSGSRPNNNNSNLVGNVVKSISNPQTKSASSQTLGTKDDEKSKTDKLPKKFWGQLDGSEHEEEQRTARSIAFKEEADDEDEESVSERKKALPNGRHRSSDLQEQRMNAKEQQQAVNDNTTGSKHYQDEDTNTYDETATWTASENGAEYYHRGNDYEDYDDTFCGQTLTALADMCGFSQNPSKNTQNSQTSKYRSKKNSNYSTTSTATSSITNSKLGSYQQQQQHIQRNKTMSPIAEASQSSSLLSRGEQTAIEVEFVDPSRPLHQTDEQRKLAVLVAMARLARDNYQREHAQLEPVAPSLPSIEESPANTSTATSYNYNVMTASEKRKFLRLLNQGQSTAQATQMVLKEREGTEQVTTNDQDDSNNDDTLSPNRRSRRNTLTMWNRKKHLQQAARNRSSLSPTKRENDEEEDHDKTSDEFSRDKSRRHMPSLNDREGPQVAYLRPKSAPPATRPSPTTQTTHITQAPSQQQEQQHQLKRQRRRALSTLRAGRAGRRDLQSLSPPAVEPDLDEQDQDERSELVADDPQFIVKSVDTTGQKQDDEEIDFVLKALHAERIVSTSGSITNEDFDRAQGLPRSSSPLADKPENLGGDDDNSSAEFPAAPAWSQAAVNATPSLQYFEEKSSKDQSVISIQSYPDESAQQEEQLENLEQEQKQKDVPKDVLTLDPTDDLDMELYLNSTDIYSVIHATTGSVSHHHTESNFNDARSVSSGLSVSTRKRRPGAAKSRLLSSTSPQKHKRGWHESMQAAAASAHMEWEVQRGFRDFHDPGAHVVEKDYNKSNDEPDKKMHLDLAQKVKRKEVSQQSPTPVPNRTATMTTMLSSTVSSDQQQDVALGPDAESIGSILEDQAHMNTTTDYDTPLRRTKKGTKTSPGAAAVRSAAGTKDPGTIRGWAESMKVASVVAGHEWNIETGWADVVAMVTSAPQHKQVPDAAETASQSRPSNQQPGLTTPAGPHSSASRSFPSPNLSPIPVMPSPSSVAKLDEQRHPLSPSRLSSPPTAPKTPQAEAQDPTLLVLSSPASSSMDFVQMGTNGSLHVMGQETQSATKGVSSESGAIRASADKESNDSDSLVSKKSEVAKSTDSTRRFIRPLRPNPRDAMFPDSRKRGGLSPSFDEYPRSHNELHPTPSSSFSSGPPPPPPPLTPQSMQSSQKASDRFPTSGDKTNNGDKAEEERDGILQSTSFASGYSDLPENTVHVVREKVGEEEESQLFPPSHTEGKRRSKKHPKNSSAESRDDAMREFEQVVASSSIGQQLEDGDSKLPRPLINKTTNESSNPSHLVDLDDAFDEWTATGGTKDDEGDDNDEPKNWDIRTAVSSRTASTTVTKKTVPKLKANKRDTSPINGRGGRQTTSASEADVVSRSLSPKQQQQTDIGSENGRYGIEALHNPSSKSSYLRREGVEASYRERTPSEILQEYSQSEQKGGTGLETSDTSRESGQSPGSPASGAERIRTTGETQSGQSYRGPDTADGGIVDLKPKMKASWRSSEAVKRVVREVDMGLFNPSGEFKGTKEHDEDDSLFSFDENNSGPAERFTRNKLAPIRHGYGPDQRRVGTQQSEGRGTETLEESGELEEREVFYEGSEAYGPSPNRSIFQRLAECAVPAMGAAGINCGADVPSAHLAFMRDHSAVALSSKAANQRAPSRFATEFCGRPENIVEEDAGEEDSWGEGAVKERSNKSSSRKMEHSLELHVEDSGDVEQPEAGAGQIGNVVSDDFGEKTAYLEAIAIKTAVSLKRRKSDRSKSQGRSPWIGEAGVSGAASSVSSASSNHTEKWKSFLERKKASGMSSSASRNSHVTDVSKAAERYAATKVREMMEQNPSGRSKSAPRPFQYDGKLLGPYAASQRVDDGTKSTAAEDLAKARVTAIMAALS